MYRLSLIHISILIKVNQIGTLTETFDAMQMAKEAGYTAVAVSYTHLDVYKRQCLYNSWRF